MELFTQIAQILWNWPLPTALAGTHILLTLRLHGIQRKVFQAVRCSFSSAKQKNGISGFSALATSVGAAMGAGNILGMGVAVTAGGPGAVFWFFVAGTFGMATQYAESRICLAFREQDQNGRNWGGPMLVLQKNQYPVLGNVYAALVVLASLGTGCVLQAHAIVQALEPWHIPAPLTSALLVLFSGSVILFGGTRIAHASERLVPAMILLYLAGCMGMLVLCRRQVLSALALIFQESVSLRPALGGGLGAAVRSGFARGLLAGEAGLGTCGIVAAAADTDPENQALISMSTGLWTTLLGVLTGLALTAARLEFPSVLAGASAGAYTVSAFSLLPGGVGLLAVCLCIFSFTSILGWCYYGQTGVRALCRGRLFLWLYKLVFLLVLGTAFCADANALWGWADLLNGLVAIPNLFCLWKLQILPAQLTNRTE